MGVLYVILYARNASCNLDDQSFLEVETVFSKICLISLLETSTFPLVWG